MVARLRFAPSPTDFPHVEQLRLALFTWALARSLKGDFIVRLENGAYKPEQPNRFGDMQAALRWLRIDWDEGPEFGGEYGPYEQTGRLARHQAVIEQLLSTGQAYYGDNRRSSAESNKQQLFLRMPTTGVMVIEDAIHGRIEVRSGRQQDPMIASRDGTPCFILANAVDDHDMEISHVVRPNQARDITIGQCQLYRALEWEPPTWVHLPALVTAEGNSLKQRDAGGSYLLADIEYAGYLPKAVFNYLLLLGWTPNNADGIVDKWDVRQQFALSHLSTEPSRFDWNHLKLVNRSYMQRMSDSQLAAQLLPYLEEVYEYVPRDERWLAKLTNMIRDGLATLEEAPDQVEWALNNDFEYTDEAEAILAKEASERVLTRLIAMISHRAVILDEKTATSIVNQLMADLITEHGAMHADIQQSIRAALTGFVNGPPVESIMLLLGSTRVKERLATALGRN